MHPIMLCSSITATNLPRRGQRADFQVLKDAGIELKGKIALSMYGGIYRGTKVKNAQVSFKN
jgi:hypothetical protein